MGGLFVDWPSAFEAPTMFAMGALYLRWLNLFARDLAMIPLVAQEISPSQYYLFDYEDNVSHFIKMF